MEQYLELLKKVMTHGEERFDRTGIGTVSLFGQTLFFDFSDGFPLITTKKIHLVSVVSELLWFLSGGTNVRDLHQHGVTIWDEWADVDGSLGPIYGFQWRSWPNRDSNGSIDQLSQAIDKINNAPHSRRIVVSAYNVAYLPDEGLSPQQNVAMGMMALPPCHVFFQFYVRQSKFLDCLFFMRSVDCFLGLPFNICSYALLTSMVAQQTDLTPGMLIVNMGDTHIYSNHFDQVREQLSRNPYPRPTLVIRRKPGCLFEYEKEDFSFVDYQFHPAIKAPIAV
ncbi:MULTISPECIES: thymidylate synthase [Candidatus Ichthyocystis]|uniref:Thymidylate synthase n=1 Tax=Candidatus Ichthyocystis hellenicum TaxID=1561003 RepID=A0A0S4M4G5_9BURK|nr:MULTISPECIES: thymidylate synthase [Ichthyocystis]CUT17048.1 Thymidylate synthase [Candidatus Ichthyocystis hellenicum]